MPFPQSHEGIAPPLIPWDCSTDLSDCQPLSAVVNFCQNLNCTPFKNHFGVKAALSRLSKVIECYKRFHPVCLDIPEFYSKLSEFHPSETYLTWRDNKGERPTLQPFPYLQRRLPPALCTEDFGARPRRLLLLCYESIDSGQSYEDTRHTWVYDSG